jgi:hypothetical protein
MDASIFAEPNDEQQDDIPNTQSPSANSTPLQDVIKTPTGKYIIKKGHLLGISKKA